MQHILKDIRVTEVKQGSVIYQEGDKADGALFFILSGRVNVFKTVDGEPKQIDSLGEGQFFGEVGILIDYARTASVIAASSSVRLARITTESFLKEAAHNMKFALKMIGITIQRLARVELKLQMVTESFRVDLDTHPLRSIVHENRRSNLLIAENLHSLRSMLFVKGKSIYNEGDRDSGDLFLVLKGQIELTHNFEKGMAGFYPLYAGDFFGMTTLTGLGRRPYSAIVTADHTSICSFDKNLFSRVLQYDPDIIYNIFRTMVTYSTILDESIRKKGVDAPAEAGRINKMEATIREPEL
ncbi:MAG: cyclic nucleotide-binding domain-containing protein [Leptospiraceae bacterium]|nr:cyclic nucleotide-binding domain-containing protein [Leptospiraceae bacterium]MCB1170140.1 cyclic nucleotide-binding domain-containing protein [Leptospiraceae bacterium]